jgi:hypothetical protein
VSVKRWGWLLFATWAASVAYGAVVAWLSDLLGFGWTAGTVFGAIAALGVCAVLVRRLRLWDGGR